MEINRTDVAPVPVEPKVGGMVMVSACKYLKGCRGRESSLVACGSRGQSWDCCVEALVGRFPPRQQKGLSTGTPLRRERAGCLREAACSLFRGEKRVSTLRGYGKGAVLSARAAKTARIGGPRLSRSGGWGVQDQGASQLDFW